MKGNSPNQQRKSSTLKTKCPQKQTIARSISPPPPPMPPKPSPSTIHRALAVDKEKILPPRKSHATDVVVPPKNPAIARSKSISAPATTKTALPPLPPLPPEDAVIKILADEDSDIEEDELEGDENTDSSYPNSSESDFDNNLIKQVQQAHVNYTKKEHIPVNSMQSNKQDIPKRSKKLPPPPPPSKKYDGSGDAEIQPTTIAAASVAAPILKPPETPPSIINIPLVIETQGVQTTVEAVSVNQRVRTPQLPPRPSRSTLARAHTIASAPRRRASRSLSPEFDSYDADNDEKPAIVKVPIKPAMSRIDYMTTSIYPDLTQATRNPPINVLDKPFLTGHRGALTGLVASKNLLVTCSGSLCTWDIKKNVLTNTISIDNNNSEQGSSPETNRIRAIAFAPTRNPKEEGRYLWVARQDTMLCVLDLQTGKVISKRGDVHAAPIVFLLRSGNTEIWSIDQLGFMNIWNTISLDSPNLLKTKPRQFKVTPQAVAATIFESKLWISSGRNLVMHCIPPPNISNDPLSFTSARVPNDMGNITKLISIPCHPCRLFASHDDGKISIWNTKTMERIQVITVSMYRICTMVSVGEYTVWAGYNTGMIYVYDTRPDKWVVLKMWRAHSAAVTQLYVDETGLLLNEHSGRLQVVSGDAYGYVGVWDGLLTEHWKDDHLQQRESEFCSYNDVKVMICSWNVDATKPEQISEQDQKSVKEWLGALEDPDIIVVGMQEVVDLVSKKQTARSLFFKKKIETSEPEELKTNRYKLWLDYLVQIIAVNYGKGTFMIAKTDELVGLFSCVFIRTCDKDRVFRIASTSVKTGLKVMSKSLHGNKGGIAIRLVYDHSSLCFVNCHLAAGQSHMQQRNADAEGIIQSASFPSCDFADVFYHGGNGAMILDHEYCFLSGDLNYRINLKRSDVLKDLTDPDKESAWKKLQDQDQLLRQKINNPLFKLLTFEEAPIRFDPTYKYEKGTDFYDRSEKRRIPAWCDRVLYKGKHINNLFYRRFEPRCSDHRPIAAGFSFKTKITEQKKRDAVVTRINEEWREYIDKFVRDRKARYVSEYGKCSESQAFELLEKENWNVPLTVQKLMDNK